MAHHKPCSHINASDNVSLNFKIQPLHLCRLSTVSHVAYRVCAVQDFLRIILDILYSLDTWL